MKGQKTYENECEYREADLENVSVGFLRLADLCDQVVEELDNKLFIVEEAEELQENLRSLRRDADCELGGELDQRNERLDHDVELLLTNFLHEHEHVVYETVVAELL